MSSNRDLSSVGTALKKDWIEQPIICICQNFDCYHLGEITLCATALDLQSEDYESKT